MSKGGPLIGRRRSASSAWHENLHAAADTSISCSFPTKPATTSPSNGQQTQTKSSSPSNEALTLSGSVHYRLANGSSIRLIAGVLLPSGRERWRKCMKVASKRTAIATSTVACVALLSFSYSEQDGISLGVEIAEARVVRASPPISATGIARRQYRRSVYGGYGVFADAVAATTSPWHYDDYYCYRGRPPGGYYSSYAGGYCVSSSNVTGLYARPTLFPRFYSDWGR